MLVIKLCSMASHFLVFDWKRWLTWKWDLWRRVSPQNGLIFPVLWPHTDCGFIFRIQCPPPPALLTTPVDKRLCLLYTCAQCQISASNGDLLNPPLVHPGDMFWWVLILLYCLFHLNYDYIFIVSSVWTVQGRILKVEIDDRVQVEVPVKAGKVMCLTHTHRPSKWHYGPNWRPKCQCCWRKVLLL